MSALYILFLIAFFCVHYDKSIKGSQNFLGRNTVILNIQSTKILVLSVNSADFFMKAWKANPFQLMYFSVQLWTSAAGVRNVLHIHVL